MVPCMMYASHYCPEIERSCSEPVVPVHLCSISYYAGQPGIEQELTSMRVIGVMDMDR